MKCIRIAIAGALLIAIGAAASAQQAQNTVRLRGAVEKAVLAIPGVAQVILPFAPEAPRAITPRIALLNTLFIPELPQRPPRA